MNKPIDSIIAREWEYIDPTPDIFALFHQFDQRFFNGRLQGVEVKWSPRMTLCAGVCSYEGRGGLCSVRLSSPLLKLRPRKDLVETLLHEMIHAYLFVTQNNRDRDGHGPEFQKHMHRINKESGCNITIYHSFHEEVKLYQQHIWRCDGPCTNRRPFFGFVRRSMNRAPSSKDFWWAEHQLTCGGKFIKIKEPENFKEKKKTKATTKANNGDIRNFIKVTGETSCQPGTSGYSSNTNVSGLKSKEGLVKSISTNSKVGSIGITTTSGLKNVKGIGDLIPKQGVTQSGTSGLPVGNISGSLGNVRSFGGTRQVTGNISGAIRGAVSNRSGTLVVTGGRGRAAPSIQTSETQSDFIPFQGKGFVLGKGSGVSKLVKPIIATDISTQTSSSQSNNKSATTSKSVLIDKEQNPPLPVSDNVILVDTPPKKKVKPDDTIVSCPVCNRYMSILDVDEHLNSCLPIGPPEVINVEDEEEVEQNLVKCPLCDSYCDSYKLEGHITNCVQNLHDVFEKTENDDKNDNANASETMSNVEVIENSLITVSCPVCQNNVYENEINEHLDNCLSVKVITGGFE